jgi:hypothetical protein
MTKESGSSSGLSGDSSGGSSSGNRKFGNGYPKKNTQEVGMVAYSEYQPVHSNYSYVANIAPQRPPRPQGPPQYYPPLYQPNYQPHNPQQFHQQPYHYPPPQHQLRPQAQQQPRPPRNQFPPIPVLYKDLLPSLLARNLVQLKAPPRIQNPLPHWYRADRTCEFHQGAPGHDVEHCICLKEEVQKLIQSKDLSFTDLGPNVQVNPLPNHNI